MWNSLKMVPPQNPSFSSLTSRAYKGHTRVCQVGSDFVERSGRASLPPPRWVRASRRHPPRRERARLQPGTRGLPRVPRAFSLKASLPVGLAVGPWLLPRCPPATARTPWARAAPARTAAPSRTPQMFAEAPRSGRCWRPGRLLRGFTGFLLPGCRLPGQGALAHPPALCSVSRRRTIFTVKTFAVS